MKPSSQMLLLGLAASLLSSTGFYMIYVSGSDELSDEEKKVDLRVFPLWNGLPVDDQERLVQGAKHYGSLSPELQHRVSERFLTWTMLGTAECSSAREQFRKFRSLPPSKRRALINKWKKKHLA